MELIHIRGSGKAFYFNCDFFLFPFCRDQLFCPQVNFIADCTDRKRVGVICQPSLLKAVLT